MTSQMLSHLRVVTGQVLSGFVRFLCMSKPDLNRLDLYFFIQKYFQNLTSSNPILSSKHEDFVCPICRFPVTFLHLQEAMIEWGVSIGQWLKVSLAA
jgi:hypothetical protein